MSNTEALKIARDALELASDIADRVPTRWHELNPSNSPAEHDIGCMVNAQPDGQHGYRLIHDALSAVRTALAQPQPSAPTETSGQRAAWTAVMQALDEVSPGWCKGADTPMSQAVAAIRWMAQPSVPSAEPLTADQESRCMFVARLENMQQNGHTWLTVPAVLALLNDCDMLASLHGAAPTAPAPLPAALLVRDLAASLSVEPLDVCKALDDLGHGQYSVNMAVPAAAVGAVERYFGAAPQAAPVAPEPVKADGRLHADGYFTWARRDGYAMDKKLPCDFYLAATPPAAPAPAVQPLSEEAIERHAMSASICPPGSQVMLVGTLRKLGITAAPAKE